MPSNSISYRLRTATATAVASKLGGIGVLLDAHRAACNANRVATANLLADYVAEALPYDEPCPPSATIPLFTGDWKARMADAKFFSTSLWESRDSQGQTPFLVACSSLPLDVIVFLQSRGADCTKASLYHASALHIAMRRRYPEVFTMLVRSDVSPHTMDNFGVSPTQLVMVYGMMTTFILHDGISLSGVPPLAWHAFMGPSFSFLSQDFKRYLRKLGRHELGRIANLYPKESWSPLCRFALSADVETLGNLLELGADIDHEGSPEGSALMVACASGVMASVKFLVRRRASLCYQAPDGQLRSALEEASKTSASITHWLLVGRFTEQARIGPPVPAEQAEEVTRCWSGGATAEYLIMGDNKRRPYESPLDYHTRLMKIKEEMRGEVVPSADNRKTSRLSK